MASEKEFHVAAPLLQEIESVSAMQLRAHAPDPRESQLTHSILFQDQGN